MNQRQLASVLFAAVGVFIAASRLPEIFIHAAALVPSDENPAAPVNQRLILFLGLTSSLLAGLIGFALVLLRDRLANRLFPTSVDQPFSSRDIQAVAFSVLGCYFGVQGLARLARPMWAWQVDWSGAALLVLGVGLFLGARGLSRLWSLGRSAGKSSSASEGAVQQAHAAGGASFLRNVGLCTSGGVAAADAPVR